MAWTVPTAGADFAVSEVVTAAKMNSHVTDNLRYLKGLAGNITFESGIIVQPTPSGTALVRASVPTTADFAVMELVGGRTWQFGTGGSATGAPYASGFYISDQTAGQLRMLVDSSGNVGFGTSSPQGRIHAVSAGGGFMFLSANAVDGTLQTLAVAGTVTQFATFWAIDRNNTGGGLVPASGNSINLGGSFGLVNTDTVTVAVTGGGAITVQRTAGSSGTHQVLLLVLYK
jgi:hypothetical protein